MKLTLLNTLERYRRYGPALNTYDSARALAVIAMLVEHIGDYFAPDQPLWHSLGIAMPVFLFLVGYSGKYTRDYNLIAGAVALIALDLLTGYPLFPLNILVTIGLGRMLLQWLDTKGWMQSRPLEITIALLVWIPVSRYAFEFGSLGFMFILLGYWVRHPASNWQQRVSMAIPLLVYPWVEIAAHGFNATGIAVMIASLLVLYPLLLRFQIAPITQLAPHNVIAVALKYIGRNSLIIYVLHLWLLQWVAEWLYPARYAGFHWI